MGSNLVDQSFMKDSSKKIAATTLVVAALVVAWLAYRSPFNPDGLQPIPDRERPKSAGPAQQNNPNILKVPGLGGLPYKSKETGISSSGWVRKINPLLGRDREADEILALREEHNAWNDLNLYYGESGEIVRIEVNNDLFETHPLDDIALSKLQNEQGLAIVRTGYPADLLAKGYSNEDLMRATRDEWDSGRTSSKDFLEIEITPVVVKIFPVNSLFDEVRGQEFVGKEMPMLLIKDGQTRNSEDDIATGPGMAGFEANETIHRSWELRAYTDAWGDLTYACKGSVWLNEPLLSAWEKHKAEHSKPHE